MDVLGHVNNVTYVDYLQEARIDMLWTHSPDSRVVDLAEGVVVVRHEVEYLLPLTFRHTPVIIESWVTEIRAATFTMAYEVFDETPEGRVVYLRAKTLLTPYVFAEERPRRLNQGERDALKGFLADDDFRPTSPMTAPRVTDEGTFALNVRFSDVDVYGHVNNVKYFEFFQEARIDYMSRIWEEIPEETPRVPLVIAQMDVDYKEPILFRLEPYAVQSWVSHVGTSSFVIESEIREGDRLFSRARVVLVTFDRKTQKAAPAPAAYRDLLRGQLPA
jgi:acyl-CoA thioester hydrolase